jgi:hypothetical protein
LLAECFLYCRDVKAAIFNGQLAEDFVSHDF